MSVTESLPATAAIRAEPDGYDMAKVQLMGRQAAGHGFLRAAVQARGDQPVYAFSHAQRAVDGFKAIVRSIDAAAPVDWIHAEHLNRLDKVGVLYLADSTVATHARLRQRVGLTGFSLCGVTHTTASHGSMDEIAGLLREPVAPWDALICTSRSVVETVRRIHEAEADYLRWRFGPETRIEGPQLPLIPLGVHCDDFAYDVRTRADARQALGLADDEVVALFVGRLVYHAKAHPYAMYRGLQLAAERTGKRMVLVMSGWFPNASIEEVFRSGARQFAPDVRLVIVDGRKPANRDHVWAGADMFISLSDSIQETFGLTPIEAMAAGLPVVVTDYDGYKDTVRHEVDGFRVRTMAPGAGVGVGLARAYEALSLNYDGYCWATTAATAVDIAQVTDAIAALATDPALRRRMGDAGRTRAREIYDWPVVFRQYQALWADLNARRRAAAVDPALQARLAALPRAAASRLDPFHAFGHYPTEVIGPETRLALAVDAPNPLGDALFGSLSLPPAHSASALSVLRDGPETVGAMARQLGLDVRVTARVVALLSKAGLVSLKAEQPSQ